MNARDLKSILYAFSNLNVLVIGDIIIDEYVFCDVVGLMSKDRGISVRYKSEERYLGGVLAIARHISSFVNSTTVCSILGQEGYIHSKLLNELSKDILLDLSIVEDYRTVIKRRIIEKHGEREEYSKLFSINKLMDIQLLIKVNKEDFYSKLKSKIEDYDLVIISDFGHGLIDQNAMEIIQEKAKFLALNCQTNSTNYGTNLITKYNRADSFSLDERELALAFNSSEKDFDKKLEKLKQHLSSNYGWLTLGSSGAMGIDKDENIVKKPALTLSVKDTVGAGDAFFSVSSLCAKTGLPIEEGTVLSNIGGALAANTLGNSKPLTREEFIDFANKINNSTSEV